MMMRLTWVVVIVLILGAGCVSSSTGGLEVALAEGGVQAAIRVDDRQFKRLINVENAIARRAASGFLEANVVTRNRTRNDLPIQYKFEWFDKDGMAVQPGGRPWEQTTIHGGESVTLSATAPEKNGVRYIVRMRRIN